MRSFLLLLCPDFWNWKKCKIFRQMPHLFKWINTNPFSFIHVIWIIVVIRCVLSGWRAFRASSSTSPLEDWSNKQLSKKCSILYNKRRVAVSIASYSRHSTMVNAIKIRNIAVSISFDVHTQRLNNEFLEKKLVSNSASYQWFKQM